MGAIIREIGSIFIPVKNLEESIHWYESILGFQLTVNWGLGATLKLNHTPTVLGLIQVDEKQPVTFKNKDALITPYYNFLTEDVHSAHEYLKNNGVNVFDIRDNGDFYLMDFEDPDGNLLSLIDLNQDSRWLKSFTK
ncbi:VOC family protein [Paenibacillus sp. chi10]|uniref:VOC family protein n=1 Tax=Paenibacillus suaedae TaxID=3077233 RepID=A0AAJ2N5F0_9BACL|nr:MULTISPECIES: VOC family protein [unclassified Paenibacillus]MDT8977776.1 VOC family protein [Paenibacillus sp. chi10]GAV12934.1 glyoxalase/bleomycin resistance protein/dioxygenase [Paenibacillus sp. NAIST15-1]